MHFISFLDPALCILILYIMYVFSGFLLKLSKWEQLRKLSHDFITMISYVHHLWGGSIKTLCKYKWYKKNSITKLVIDIYYASQLCQNHTFGKTQKVEKKAFYLFLFNLKIFRHNWISPKILMGWCICNWLANEIILGNWDISLEGQL